MNPLWMPKGTVRSIIALSLTLATITTVILQAIGFPNAEKAFGGLVGLTGAMIVYYFTTRGKA